MLAMKQKMNKETAVFVLVMFIIGAIMLLFNYYTPMYADDYAYKFSFADGSRIDDVWDIFPSMKAHYYHMNGRVVTHFIAQILLMMPAQFVDVCNTIAFLLLGLFVYCYSGFGIRCGKRCLPWLIAIYFVFLYVSPAFGQSYLWTTASANYLYGPLIIMAFFMPYYRLLNCSCKLQKQSIIWTIANFIIGLLAGATSENMSIAVIVMAIAVTIYVFVMSHRIYFWTVTGIVGAIAGFIFLLLAPGNYKRASTVGGLGGPISWIKRAILITCRAADVLLPILILFAIFGIIFIMAIKAEGFKVLIIKLKNVLLFFLGASVSLYAMSVSPQFPDRAWVASISLATAATGSLLCELRENKQITFKKFTEQGITVLVSLLFLANCVNAYFALKPIYYSYCDREKSITMQMEAGEKTVYIDAICGDGKYSCFLTEGDVSEDDSMWINREIARYYEIERVYKTQ